MSVSSKIKKVLLKILYILMPIKPLRRSLKSAINGWKNNKIIFIKDGKEHVKKWYELCPKRVRVSFRGSDNVVKIELPFGKHKNLQHKIRIRMKGSHNTAYIHKNVSGKMSVFMHHGDQNYFEVGENTFMVDIGVSLANNTCKIGKNCMLSNSIRIWGDTHSVLDYKTGKVLNVPKTPILVGDHVWLGERVTLTKGAQIPDDCIVGIASVVTKKFDKPHCVIAGSPALVKKEGISWDEEQPMSLAEKIGEA